MITLTTDFGEGLYSAQVKGRILSINPDARVVDITHSIAKFDILEGAFLVNEVSKYFPRGTIHIAVVDPGVGGRRSPIVVETERGFFIGPDNGIFTFLHPKRIFEISLQRLYDALGEKKDVSSTFHARDIFGPAAALLSKGVGLGNIGKEKPSMEIIEIEPPSFSAGKSQGRVIYIDSFGNIITNIKYDYPNGSISVSIGKKKAKAEVCSTFSDVPEGRIAVLKGSHGFIEIDVHKGNASKFLGAEKRAKVTLSRRKP
ncbi:MAG: SAM-dependent chlorinase/fluorinase [Candidatus Aenigmarchaeota archaeon]|nr:SAM-dependent chlorinase/fluorinase [Candidatus Aenigmarchaeota archaeon]